eukprot:9181145-Heterocapsa_arctica.AAC.1
MRPRATCRAGPDAGALTGMGRGRWESLRDDSPPTAAMACSARGSREVPVIRGRNGPTGRRGRAEPRREAASKKLVGLS